MFKILITIIILTITIYPQTIVEKYQPPEGYLRIGPEPERMIPMVEKGFTLILPDSETKGVVVIPGSKRFDIKKSINKEGTLENVAVKKNFAVINILTGNPLDFYFDNDVIKDVAKRLQNVLIENNLREKPIYFTGLSLAGTRCLKLAIFLQRNKATYWLQPSAVAIFDAPLDMVRFWDAENRAIINNFYPDASAEERRVTYLLKENLGTPQENFDNYVDYSPFVYTASDGGNAKYLRNVPIRAYIEADVNWWIENRRKDYYSMNSIDLAALINQLKLLHNDESELITTCRKREGYDEGLSPRTDIPQSGIDYSELLDWFLSHQN
jgi:hypothetical protein